MKKIKISASQTTSEISQIIGINIAEPESCPNYAAIKKIVCEVEAKKQTAKVVRSSADAANCLDFLRYKDVECFYLITLRKNNSVINIHEISTGGISSTVVDTLVILKKVIMDESPCFILGHNHPSGNLNPSNQDIAITDKIKHAANFLDIKLLDHIIIPGSGGCGYYSFVDEGKI